MIPAHTQAHLILAGKSFIEIQPVSGKVKSLISDPTENISYAMKDMCLEAEKIPGPRIDAVLILNTQISPRTVHVFGMAIRYTT